MNSYTNFKIFFYFDTNIEKNILKIKFFKNKSKYEHN